PDLTVAENVFIGHAPSGRLGTIDWSATRRSAARLFDQLDVQFDVGAPVRGLSMADQQLIEIAKSLSVDARVLILDEPTASLSAHEVERLFVIVRRLRERGVAILFVSHRLDEVFALCDRATVFRDGRHVVTMPTNTMTTADLVRHMVGRAVSLFPKVETPIGDVLLEVDGLSRSGSFRDVTFMVRSGEIVVVDELVGALSGGNQQKVVLAKWLASKPRVLILDEPTRGIDIGAKVEVHRIISELAASGLGIVLISSDLPEVLAMSDRILVMHE